MFIKLFLSLLGEKITAMDVAEHPWLALKNTKGLLKEGCRPMIALHIL